MLALTMEFICDACGKIDTCKGTLDDLRNSMPPEVWNGEMKAEVYCPDCKEHPFEKVLREAFGMGPEDTEGKMGDWSAKIVEKKITLAKKIPDEKAG